MFSIIKSAINYFFHPYTDEPDDIKNDYLTDEILDLEALNKNICDLNTELEEVPETALCFQKTGTVSFVSDNEYVLIDGMLYYDISTCTIQINVNDQVLYMGYNDEKGTVVVVRILVNYGQKWGDVEENEENKFEIKEHILVGEVDCRKDRMVFMKGCDVKFNLDNVESSFVPVKGDWVEMKCNIQWDKNKPHNIDETQVLQVNGIKPLRIKIKSATITSWFGDFGICDRNIYFDKQCFQYDFNPIVGSKVLLEAIESNQQTCSWRATKLVLEQTCETKVLYSKNDINMELEKEKNIEMTFPVHFQVSLQETATMDFHISNNSAQSYIINKWIILNKRKDSQVDVKPYLTQPKILYPNNKVSFQITCCPKFLGESKECFIIMFKGFQLKRYIKIEVTDSLMKTDYKDNNNHKNYNKNMNLINMRNIRYNNNVVIVPGTKVVKPPAFIAVKIGNFSIPNVVWSAIIGDSEQTINTSDYEKILVKIENQIPCLSQTLNINNYIDRWHNLLYMEEIQANINMRAYDMSQVFLSNYQDYLAISIPGLSERRPSLMKGDRVLVKDSWTSNGSTFEGYIHDIKGDQVLMKFNQKFHEIYSGSDVSIEFHFSRMPYRKLHQAVNLAIANLGPHILFPNRMKIGVNKGVKAINEIDWFNESLNEGQKTAVLNILKAECRPLPYCIYGPPGTGKTVTVVEAILQILKFSDSRILIATPSNSAANIITERLLMYKEKFSNSIIRIIANHLLDSDNISNSIRPFCATLNIARENSSKDIYYKDEHGSNINCQYSFIGRHRITIGTCVCLGTLYQMGFPHGHFTHVIVDEAGQATEPEIMIPLTFIDKEQGQIILAGDPMQLGPVVLSKYCVEFGLGESYLSRILDTYPYQKDFVTFKDGYDNRLVTRLVENYRSVKEVLNLPSEMFYNGSLKARLKTNQPWVEDTLKATSELLSCTNARGGGIFVHGIKGSNMRAEDSPSWYNPQEAAMVALTVCKLYKNKIIAENIGIITPYIAQVRHTKKLFDAMGLPQPKIGTVEDFQGQERQIIIISTVRSSDLYLDTDIKHTLGFLRNPKRLNVALTRAQLAVFLFCNPHVLATDPLWYKVIKQSVEENRYVGCDLPSVFESE